MKVLQVIHSLVRGGLENGVVNLLNGLPEDIEQHVACLDKRGEMADRLTRDISIHVLDRKRHDLKLPFRLARLMRQIQPDVVHCRNWNSWLDTVVAHRLAGCPGTLVWSFHGFAGGAEWSAKRAAISRVLFHLTDEIFAVCDDSAQRYAAFAGLDADRFAVLYNGVDLSRFQPDRDAQALRSELGLPADAVIVTTVASLTEVKDHAALLRAMALVDEKLDANLYFLWLGDGPLREPLEQQADQLGVSKRLAMPGNSDRVADYLGASDITLLPSRLEGMSNTILEAMAMALPVIANNVGGNPELVIDGESGLLCEQGNDSDMAAAIIRLATSKGLRQQMGQAGRLRAEAVFAMDVMMGNYAEYYKKVANV